MIASFIIHYLHFQAWESFGPTCPKRAFPIKRVKGNTSHNAVPNNDSISPRWRRLYVQVDSERERGWVPEDRAVSSGLKCSSLNGWAGCAWIAQRVWLVIACAPHRLPSRFFVCTSLL